MPRLSVRWRSGRRRDRCGKCWRRWRSAPPAGRRDGPRGPRSRRGGPGRRPRPTRIPPDSRSPSYTCLRSSKTQLPIGGTRRPEPAGRRSTTPFGPPGIPIPRGVAMHGGPTGSVSSTARIRRGPSLGTGTRGASLQPRSPGRFELERPGPAIANPNSIGRFQPSLQPMIRDSTSRPPLRVVTKFYLTSHGSYQSRPSSSSGDTP